MMPIAMRYIGIAPARPSSAIAARFSSVRAEHVETREDTAELGGGIAAEAVAGIAGIALGVLALLRVVPLTLASIAIIVFGGALLLGSGASSRINAPPVQAGEGGTRRVAREGVYVSTGGHVLIGIAAVVLGILALLGMRPLLFDLIAVLAVAFALLFLSGTIVGRRARRAVHRF
jgi:hypothetical protein